MKKKALALMDHFISEDGINCATVLINYSDKIVQYSRNIERVDNDKNNLECHNFDVVELDKATKKIRRYKTVLIDERDVDEELIESFEEYNETVDINKLEAISLTRLTKE